MSCQVEFLNLDFSNACAEPNGVAMDDDAGPGEPSVRYRNIAEWPPEHASLDLVIIGAKSPIDGTPFNSSKMNSTCAGTCGGGRRLEEDGAGGVSRLGMLQALRCGGGRGGGTCRASC